MLFLQDPPYFNVRPGGEYRQEAGRELVIPCAASGDPDIPTITWRKVRQLNAMVLHVEISVHRKSLSLLCPLKVGKPSKSKHNVLPSGSLQFLSLSKEDHGEWECVATNVVTSITASTRILVIGINTMLCTFCPRRSYSQILSIPLFCTAVVFQNASPLGSVPLGVIKISLDLICNSFI